MFWKARATPSRAIRCGRMRGEHGVAVAHLAGGGPVDAGEHVEHRRLAGAVGADDRVHGAGLDREGHVGERLDGAEPDADARRSVDLGRIRPRRRRLRGRPLACSLRTTAPGSGGAGGARGRRGSARRRRARGRAAARRRCARARRPSPPATPGRRRARRPCRRRRAPSSRSARPAAPRCPARLISRITSPIWPMICGREPQRRLVEQQQPRAGHQRRDRSRASAAHRRRAGRPRCAPPLGEHREQLVDPLVRLRPWPPGPAARDRRRAGSPRRSAG